MENWKQKPLSQVVSRWIRGTTLNRSRADYYTKTPGPESLPWARVGDMKEGLLCNLFLFLKHLLQKKSRVLYFQIDLLFRSVIFRQKVPFSRLDLIHICKPETVVLPVCRNLYTVAVFHRFFPAGALPFSIITVSLAPYLFQTFIFFLLLFLIFLLFQIIIQYSLGMSFPTAGQKGLLNTMTPERTPLYMKVSSGSEMIASRE